MARASEPHVLDPDVSRRAQARPLRRDRVGNLLDPHRSVAAHRDELDPPGFEGPHPLDFLPKRLLLREALLDAVEQGFGDLGESLTFGDRGEVSETYPFAARFAAAVVVAHVWSGDARLEEVVASQGREAFGELCISEPIAS